MVETGRHSDALSSMSVMTGVSGGIEVLVNIKYQKSLLQRKKEQSVLHACSEQNTKYYTTVKTTKLC